MYPPEDDRADRRAAAQRCGEPGRPRRGARGVAGQAVPVVFPGQHRTTGRHLIRGWPDMWCRRTGYGPTTCTGRSSRSSTSDPFWSCGPTTGSAWSPRWSASKGVAYRLAGQQQSPSRWRDRRRGRRQDRRLPHAVRIVWAADHFAVRHAGIHGRAGRGKARPRSGDSAGCSSLGARLTVPFGMIILRKGYGLGAMAMAGGSFHAPQFTVAWPTGEIGGMGLEGAVRLGFSKELAAAADPGRTPEIVRQAGRRRPTSTARRCGRPPRSNSTTSSTRRTPGPGSPGCRESEGSC